MLRMNKIWILLPVLSLMVITSSCNNPTGIDGQITEPEYTVTFDPNGGEIISGNSEQVVKEGDDAVAPVVKNGNHILSWDTDFTNVTSNLIVKAQWKKAEYIVTFDPNGGEIISGEKEQVVKEGDSAVAPVVKNGNLVLSWDTNFTNVTSNLTVKAQWDKVKYIVTFDPNGGEIISGEKEQSVKEGDSAVAPVVKNGNLVLSWDTNFTNVTSNLTVKAQWKKAEYIVTFDPNGGEIISGEKEQVVKEGDSAVAPVVKNGSHVLSWDIDFTNVTSNLTVKAQWDIAEYIVTFNLNGGEIISGESEQVVKEGAAAVAPVVKNGNLILSWDIDFTNVTSNLTVKAQWKKAEYTVTFDPNGGEIISGESKQVVKEGDSAVAPVVKNGNLILSWDIDFTNVTSNLTVKAQWKKAEYTVKFNLNGGEIISGESEQVVKEGDDAVAPVVKNGNLILSWDIDFTNVTSNLTVKAQWKKAEYTVTFDPNGGEIISGESKQVVKEGDDAVAPVVKNGNLALSWDIDFTNVTSNLTVKAQWKKVQMSSQEIAAFVETSIVTVNVISENYSARGSGFFIDANGTLVTNYHVIDGATSISVQTNDGGNYNIAKIIDFNSVYDIAILKIDITDNPYLDLSKQEVKKGENVYAIGSSLGHTGTFSGGIVSATSRTVGRIECIQHDAPISGGNSGGPLVNTYGDVVGINAFSYTGGQNLNLAIKITMLDILKQDKNYSITDYKEWYTKETNRSYYIFSSDGYSKSMINTYQVVTGSPCLFSYDDVNKVDVEGYVAKSFIYTYEYTEVNIDKYTDYLKSIGFTYDDYVSDDNSVTYNYINEYDNTIVKLHIYNGDELWIMVMN